ncbi:hypothetical protein RZS08_36525, partial [Arthrospira platensis SPKY1]|nr:hypothetical protein [Arthrospira platensis SPKY1]
LSRNSSKSSKLGDVAISVDTFSLSAPERDELSTFRARKCWKQVLRERMMLEDNHDFQISLIPGEIDGCFRISCTFLTSFGRYAFWRIVSMQAPETLEKIRAAVEVPVYWGSVV